MRSWEPDHQRQGSKASASAAASQLEKDQVLATAASSCQVTTSSGVTIGDEGRTVTLDGKGQEDSTGLSLEDMVCVLMKVKTPDAVISAMDSTRALDGRQTATWDNTSASWTYHPDAGMEVILTTID